MTDASAPFNLRTAREIEQERLSNKVPSDTAPQTDGGKDK